MLKAITPSHFRSSSLFVSAGVIARLITTVVSIPILVRLLGIEQFGVWSVLIAQISLFYLVELGITTALVYYLATSIAENNLEESYKYMGSALALLTVFGLMGMIVFIILIPQFTSSLQNYSMIDKSLSLASFVILFWLWGQYCSSIEAAFLRYDIQATIETVNLILLQVGIIILAWMRMNLSIIIIWLLISSGITVTFHYFALKHILHIKFGIFSISKNKCRQLLTFGYAHWIATLGSSLFGQADRIIINFLLGPTITGIYSATTSIVMKINELSAAPLRVLPSIISTAKSLDRKSQIAKLFLQASRINGFVIIMVTLPLLLMPDVVASFIVEKPQVGVVIKILPVLAGIYSLYSLGATGFFTMIGLGTPIVNAIWGLIGGVAECLLMILLIPRFGLLGGIFANAAYIVVVIINFYSVQKLSIKWKTYLQTMTPVLLIISFGALLPFFPEFIRQNLANRIALFILCVAVSVSLIIGPRFFLRIFNIPRHAFFDDTTL
jgi:O-antigen/teichoic acid export membrane protein